ncbi:MAG: PAS domain S-box protein [Methylococcaceae bacterium]|nr:PAS domain S-box protein [Methylococcaceae bacterium]
MSKRKWPVRSNTPWGGMALLGAVVLGTECVFLTLRYQILIPLLPIRLAEPVWDVVNADVLSVALGSALHVLVIRKLQESKDLLRSIVDHVPARIFWKDRDSRYLGCNFRFAQDAGCSNPDELIGKSDFDMVWKDQAERYRADDSATMESGTLKLNYEESLTKPDGSRIWVRTSKVPLRDGHHRVIGILGIYHDCTEDKQAEGALRESEERYRSLFENMLEGYAYCRMLFEQDEPLDIVYLDVNRAFERITGLKDVIGKKTTELIPGIRASHPELFEIYGRVASTGKPEKFEIYLEQLGVWFSITAYSPRQEHFVAMFDDITERKRSEGRLRESRDLLQSIVETAPVRIFWKDRDSRYLGCNTRFAQDAGLSRPAELIGKTDFEMGWKDQAERYRADDQATMESGIPKLNYEEPQTTPDGGRIWLSTSKMPLRDDQDRVIGVLGIYQDITERKQAEQRITASEQRYHHLFENMRSGVAIYQPDAQCGTFTFKAVNQAAERIERMRREDLVGRDVEEAFPGVADFGLLEVLRRVCRSGSPESFPVTLYRDGRIEGWRENYVYRLDTGEIVAVYDNVTERVQTAEALRISTLKHRLLFESSRDALMLLTPPSWMFSEANQATLRLFGVSSVAEFTALGPWDVSPERQPDGRSSGEKALEMIATALREGSHYFEWEHRRLDGQTFAADVLLTRMEAGGERFLQATVRDITERKRAEEELRTSEFRFRSLTDHSSDLTSVINPDGVIRYQSPANQRLLGYGDGELDGRSLFEFIPPEDHERIISAIGATLTAAGKVQIVEHRVRHKDGSLRAFESVGRYLPEMAGIVVNSRDITVRKQMEQDNLAASALLKSALEAAIGAMATALEQRDPYTAGHQRRVAELAVAIAEEMGLAAEAIEGIHFGGLIHDIGKISVPVEILSKPGLLSDVELDLIKTHAEAGYQIVKGIAFPWPVADMVRQHHERLDGSGYPQSLKGGQIVLEARILAVADVLEAMTANRPYRPGLDLDAALAELKRGRGVLYDPEVVGAFLHLIREKGFIFSQ